MTPFCSSLYIHVPFCAGACDYCDFYSVPVKAEDPVMALYVDRLLEDCGYFLKKYDVSEIPSVYIGGGTPSVLGAALIKKMLDGINKLTMEMTTGKNVENYRNEVTLEVNPESCDGNLLETVKGSGVTRISAGVQTFSEKSRLAVNRAGEAGGLDKKLKLISEFFPNRFSVDLISGLPFQDEKILLRDIEKALSFDPGHISLYALTLDPCTPLADNIAKGGVSIPSGDSADNLWLFGRDTLEEAGYAQYEVSNFCIPGKESCHNLRYWRMENWLGAGPAASGTVFNDVDGTAQRFTNAADVDFWLNAKPGTAGENENIDSPDLIKETFLMGFRTVKGPDAGLFYRRFKTNIENIIPRTIKKWQSRGLLRTDRIALTGEGLLFLDAFLAEAFAETDGR